MGDHFGHPRGVHTIAMSGGGGGRVEEEGRGEGGLFGQVEGGGLVGQVEGGGLVWANMGGLPG